MLNDELLQVIQTYLEEKSLKKIKDILSKWPVADVAELLQNIDEKNMIIIFRLLPKDKAIDVFAELDKESQEKLLKMMSDQRIKEIISELPPDDRTELFEDLPGQLQQRLLNMLSSDDRREVLKLLGYPKNSVGRLMTPDYVAVRSHWTVKEAIEHIRQRGRDAETIDIIYVVNDDWRLLDDVPIRRFILADAEQKVEMLMDYHVISISAYADQEEAVKIMQQYDLTVLPVVDEDGILIGIVTIDDILDVLEEEVTEDFQKGSAIIPFEESYIKASPFFLYRKRAGWLLLLLVADFLSSNVIAHFENALRMVIALAFFIPVLIDSGGNTASQSATLVIRAIATGELNIRRWFDVVKKELITGLLLGITLGVALFLRSFFWKGGPEIGLVVGISMVAIVVWANLLGSLLPIILTKLKLDPAVISAPLLTTLCDATGLIIYFHIAKLLLKV